MKQSFNPKARWDRPVPGHDDSDAGVSNERIDVLVWFQHAKIFPRRFIWNNKMYKIKKVTYRWQERHGQELVSCFSVSTGPDLYQISFSNASFSWKIDKIIE